MATEQLKLTGGSSPYYSVSVETPTSSGTPYIAECNDIIEALDLNFAEGNILKALWRIAKARKGEGKPGNPPLYDAEKVKFFGDRVLAQAQLAFGQTRGRRRTVDRPLILHLNHMQVPTSVIAFVVGCSESHVCTVLEEERD